MRLLLAVLLFAGCTPKPVAKVETQLNIALDRAIKSLDPVHDENLVLPSLFETLLVVNPLTNKIEPGLAEALPVVEGSHLIVRLKHGIKFHSGRGVVASDFVYAWSRGPKLVARAIDDFTLELSKTVRPELLTKMSSAVVPREAVEKYADDFGNHPVGTGPYRFESWIHGNKVILRHDHGPGVDSLNIFEMPTASVRWMNLVKGAIDFDPLDLAAEVNPRVFALGLVRIDGFLHQAWVQNFVAAEVRRGQYNRLDVDSAKKTEFRSRF